MVLVSHLSPGAWDQPGIAEFHLKTKMKPVNILVDGKFLFGFWENQKLFGVKYGHKGIHQAKLSSSNVKKNEADLARFEAWLTVLLEWLLLPRYWFWRHTIDLDKDISVNGLCDWLCSFNLHAVTYSRTYWFSFALLKMTTMCNFKYSFFSLFMCMWWRCFIKLFLGRPTRTLTHPR